MHWPEAEAMLADAPELEAKTLFEWLCEQHPGKYQEGQLRTFQRRVSVWRALNGSKLLTLEGGSPQKLYHFDLCLL